MGKKFAHELFEPYFHPYINYHNIIKAGIMS